MKEHPILFNSEMVKALLEDRKAMTRRLDKGWLKVKKGDRLWVKETWSIESTAPTSYEIHYLATHPGGAKTIEAGDDLKLNNYLTNLYDTQRGSWRPSIYMFRWVSRITLEATADARLEKLQEISEEDAAKEGMPLVTYGMDRLYGPIPKATRIKGFGILWDSLNPKAPWLSNPEVVVLEFKKL